MPWFRLLSGLWLARRAAARPMQGALDELLWPAFMQATGFGAIGCVLWWMPAHAATALGALFFVIGLFSARYAIALSVHVATHHPNTAGHVWGTLQAYQSAMILVAPMLGAAVLESFGQPALFAVAAGSALLSLAAVRVLCRNSVNAAGIP